MNVAHYLPFHGTTFEEVEQYYRVRVTELGAELVDITCDVNGVYIISLIYNKAHCKSIYIPPSLRGKGLIKQYSHLPMLTIKDCGIEGVLATLGFHYTLYTGWCDFNQYELIKQFYGDRKAKRSGEFLMWHITEGCRILEDNDASDKAIKAYMLHPIFQSDEDFAKNNHLLYEYCEHDMEIVLNVLEYRKCANAYLCKPYTDNWTINEIKEAVPLVLDDVRLMLLADKTQNRKDFMKFHYGTHERSEQLFAYFNKWLEYLTSCNGMN